jgi:hypothetical protein
MRKSMQTASVIGPTRLIGIAVGLMCIDADHLQLEVSYRLLVTVRSEDDPELRLQFSRTPAIPISNGDRFPETSAVVLRA